MTSSLRGGGGFQMMKIDDGGGGGDFANNNVTKIAKFFDDFSSIFINAAKFTLYNYIKM